MIEDPDKLLLEGVASGSEEALRELMARHKDRLFRYVYRILCNEADAAEVVAGTFVRVYRSADRFRSRAKVSTWIYTIATNLCRDQLRREKRRGLFRSLFEKRAAADGDEGLSLVETIAADDSAPPQVLEQSERLGQLRALVDALPLKLKEPFVLCALEDHSHRDCARILGVSEKAVETRIYRARKLLRQQVETVVG